MFHIVRSIQIVQEWWDQRHRSSQFNLKCFSIDPPPAVGWDVLLFLGSFPPVHRKVSSDILPVQFWFDLPLLGPVQFQLGCSGFAVTSWVFMG